MLLFPPPFHRTPRRRIARGAAAPVPPPVGPVLVLASFMVDEVGVGVLTLGFDVPVEVSGIVPEEIEVVDGPGGLAYVGSGPVTVLSPSSLTVAMAASEETGGPEVLLNASALTGIVAAIGGGAWAGTGGAVELPIPAPPPPAVVIAATASGYGCTLQFDRPIALLGSMPDDAVLFDGVAAIGVANYAPDLLGFETANFLAPGATWQIYAQPDWISTPIDWPQEGVFGSELLTTKNTKGTKGTKGTKKKAMQKAKKRR